MHFCQDEALAIMSAIPAVGVFFKKIHAWFHKKTHHKCHEKDCYEDHVEHKKIGYLTKEDMDLERKRVLDNDVPIWELAGFNSEIEWETYISQHPDFDFPNDK